MTAELRRRIGILELTVSDHMAGIALKQNELADHLLRMAKDRDMLMGLRTELEVLCGAQGDRADEDERPEVCVPDLLAAQRSAGRPAVGAVEAPPGSDAAQAYDDRSREVLVALLSYGGQLDTEDPDDLPADHLLSMAYNEILRLGGLLRLSSTAAIEVVRLHRRNVHLEAALGAKAK